MLDNLFSKRLSFIIVANINFMDMQKIISEKNIEPFNMYTVKNRFFKINEILDRFSKRKRNICMDSWLLLLVFSFRFSKTFSFEYYYGVQVDQSSFIFQIVTQKKMYTTFRFHLNICFLKNSDFHCFNTGLMDYFLNKNRHRFYILFGILKLNIYTYIYIYNL